MKSAINSISENSLLIPVTFKPNDINYNVFIGTNFLNYDMLITFLHLLKNLTYKQETCTYNASHMNMNGRFGCFLGVGFFFGGGMYI